MVIPSQLMNRLSDGEHAQLRELLDAANEFLPRIYRDAVLDYQESRGDDAALFGLRVYKHLRFAVGQFVGGQTGVVFFEPNGSYEVGIGPLRIRIDLLGHSLHEDVLECFPDSSPTKVAVGESNHSQLRLEMPEVDLVPGLADYNLNRLTVGHFGNPREGLVKWYLGAWTNTDSGGQRWAWVERQDDLGEGSLPAPLKPRGPIPFNERAVDAVSVIPRRSA
jgi:hypothetical protein